VHSQRGRRPNPLLVRPKNDRLDEVISAAISDLEQLFRAQIRHFSARCESPIEELFAAASLLHREGARHLGVEMYHFGCSFNREKRVSNWDSTDVFIQAQVGAYRADFLFDDLFKGKRTLLIVELDGHEWHERTKQQAARDKKRDRALVSAGYRIMRFTGSEVYANPGECLQEVIDALLAARDCE
jgi:very-short-patch-repair endonuclease